jgi:hypothetical protein
MHLSSILIVLFMIASASGPASSAPLTGRDLTAMCASIDPRDQRACGMALAAIMTLTTREGGYGDVQYCYRGPNSDDALRRSYVASMASREDRLDLPFVTTILLWLRDAFPCS